MMKVTTLKRYQGLILTIFQTVIVLFCAFVLTFLSCGFNFENFRWLTFVINFGFTTYMKVSYTIYAKNREMLADNIVVLENTINHDRTEIYNAQKTEELEEEIERRNRINRLEAYINYLDNKKDFTKYKEMRKWAFNYKMALIEERDTIEFEEIRSINSINIYYEKIESSKLFTFGKNHNVRKKKYSFNSLSSSLNRAIIPTVASLLISIVLGGIENKTYVESGQLWVDLAGYLFSIVLGAGWGFSNGKAIIQEDYAEILNNVASLVRDMKTKILGKK